MLQRLAGTVLALLVVSVGTATAGTHEKGTNYIKEHGYQGPATCEVCHPGTAKRFLDTVHWKHSSKTTNVDNVDPNSEYGMKNRIYTMCNANEVVNSLQEIVLPDTGKVKFSGCDTCHPGDLINKPGSTGPAAEASIDCLVCHSNEYDFSKRKAFKDDKGRIAMGQDRSTKAAMAIAKPPVKNCMLCHESSGGGTLIKKGFAFTPEFDVHAEKGMVCVDCHTGKNHKLPTGYDPNNWASDDNLRISCADATCHGNKPHKDEDLNAHTARIACQTCHVTRAGGSYAKDFVQWEKTSNGFYEPATLKKDANELLPYYAWYNRTIANTPRYIGPKGSRQDPASKIYPFKVFQGKAYFNKLNGQLLLMDFAQPMATADTLAGVASAAKKIGLKDYVPEPGWQTVIFANNHLVTKTKAITCELCHAPNGVLNFKLLGYSDAEVEKLTSPEIYFRKTIAKQREEW